MLDKREGISSAQAIAEVKRKFNLKKIGHAGTLDPMATGLLVCLTGDTTRLAQYAEKGRKIYSGHIKFGSSTSTDDVMGDVLESGGRVPGLAEIEAVLPKFRGKISQVPPRVSALKVEGDRAYKLAREGKDFDLAARDLEVYEYKIIGLEGDLAQFYVECSKGTYIRALARDLGQALGSQACLASLRREGTAPFHIRDAKRIEDLSIEGMISWEQLLPQANKLQLSKGICKSLCLGQVSALREVEDRCVSQSLGGSPFLIYINEDTAKPLGLLEWKAGKLSFAVNFPQEASQI